MVFARARLRTVLASHTANPSACRDLAEEKLQISSVLGSARHLPLGPVRPRRWGDPRVKRAPARGGAAESPSLGIPDCTDCTGDPTSDTRSLLSATTVVANITTTSTTCTTTSATVTNTTTITTSGTTTTNSTITTTTITITQKRK